MARKKVLIPGSPKIKKFLGGVAEVTDAYGAHKVFDSSKKNLKKVVKKKSSR